MCSPQIHATCTLFACNPALLICFVTEAAVHALVWCMQNLHEKSLLKPLRLLLLEDGARPPNPCRASQGRVPKTKAHESGPDPQILARRSMLHVLLSLAGRALLSATVDLQPPARSW